jgi:hypothetical protein
MFDRRSEYTTKQIIIRLVIAAIIAVMCLAIGIVLLYISNNSYTTTTCIRYNLSELIYEEGNNLSSDAWSFTYRLSAINETCWTLQTHQSYYYNEVERAYDTYSTTDVTCYYLNSDSICDVSIYKPTIGAMEVFGILLTIMGSATSIIFIISILYLIYTRKDN